MSFLARGAAALDAHGHGPTDLAAAVAEQAGRLRALGAAPGRVVAVAAPEPLAYLVACLATLKTGAALAPLDTRVASHPLERLRPVVVVRDEPMPQERPHRGTEALAWPREVPAETGLVLFTSGSSGEAKAVLLPRAGLHANVAAILGYLPVRRHPRTAVVLPLHYSYALVGQALTTLAAGGTVLLLQSETFAVKQLEAMVELEAGGLSSVPTSLRLLCEAALQADARPALGYLASAGAALDPATRSLMREAFPGARRFNQYGLTEASPRVCAVADDDPAFEAGAAGYPIAGVAVQALDQAGRPLPTGETGELAVTGPGVMLGYLDDPAASAEALGPCGLRTGDVGHVDERGVVWVEGRRDGIVKVAGERVGTEEVAAVLRAAPGVTAAAVVATPDPKLGHRLVAFVEGDLASARAAARAALPPAKRPQRFEPVASLPRLPSGKPDLVALATLAGAP